MNLIFPKSSDKYVRIGLTVFAAALICSIGFSAYLTRPKLLDTGYSPVQPVAYSHKLHAGNLGIDCRYCHSTVEFSAHAPIPSSETCMNCHTRVKAQSPLLQVVRESYANGKPIPWVKVHRLPDFVYFSHEAHLSAGVSCVSCHGRVDQMQEIRQVSPLNMAWCLDCHRNPAPNIRPRALVTKLDWKPDRAPVEIGRELVAANHIAPPLNCSGCHR
jgi:menaquinone reductase, multiheme cytochrome c subunit